MKLTRRTLMAAAAAAALMASGISASAEETTLDILYCFPDFAKFHEPLAQEFMKQHPDIKIQFRAPAASYDEGHQTMLRSAMTNQLPDIYYSGYHLIAELVHTLQERDQAVPLDELLAAEGPDFRKANYFDNLIELGSLDGKLYGLAVNASNPIVYYNADLVKKAGVEPADFPHTFDGIIALAGKINDPANGINGMAYDVHGWPDGWLFESALTQAGGQLLTDDHSDIAFDGPTGLKALQTFRRFVTEGGMQPIEWTQSRQQFAAGKMGINFASPGNLTQVTGLVDGKFDFRTAKFPIEDEAKGNLPTGGNAILTFAKDEAKQKAAWEFIKFMTSPAAQKVIVEMTGYLPTNVAASGPEYLGPFYEKNPNYRTPVDQVERAGPWGAYPGGNGVRIWRAQRDIVAQVMRGDVTPEAGLEAIAKATREMLKTP